MFAVIADDDPDAGESLAMLVQPFVDEVIVVQDGQSAVRQVLSRPNESSLVLLDMEMPVLGGLDAGMQIRLALGRGPLIIGCSGARYFLQSAAKSGFFDHCFQKPLDFDRLQAALSPLARPERRSAPDPQRGPVPAHGEVTPRAVA